MRDNDLVALAIPALQQLGILNPVENWWGTWASFARKMKEEMFSDGELAEWVWLMMEELEASSEGARTVEGMVEATCRLVGVWMFMMRAADRANEANPI